MIIRVHFLIFVAVGLFWWGRSEIYSGRMRGDDEPHMVSWRVLEGVIEPFDSFRPSEVPLWKQMKNSADQKAANMMLQHALKEYGQLLRHWHFGEMPMEERYDVFLSMSKLLKMMGFHQRAELLLYEAMSYTTNPYEAHLQLGLLFLDKEDLESAKVHLKNCLFFRENDLLILSQLSVVVIAEGKLHEAKFFLSRLLAGLEARVTKLSSLLAGGKSTDTADGVNIAVDMDSITARVDYMTLSRWTEQLFSKSFHGEFRMSPSATMQLMKMFSNLYRWLSDGELSGRFVFDLGQSLYEAGRPNIGKMMMQRGFETSDPAAEGVVSTEVVKMRLALDYPVVPGSILEILESYFNMTNYLAATASVFSAVDVENVMDVYWPLPLLWHSGVPVTAIISEVMWRFEGGPDRTDEISKVWLSGQTESPCQKRAKGENGNEGNAPAKPSSKGYFDSLTSMISGTTNKAADANKGSDPANKRAEGPQTIEVGILGGHMNDHAVGHMVLHRILGIVDALASQDTNAKKSPAIRTTLIALPLVPSEITKRIAKHVTRVINLPMDTGSAWLLLEQLHLDVLLFPDDQPFPDQQSVLFRSRRIAPVQACFYVRGSSCASSAIDYYILPSEYSEYYLQGVPAADIDSINMVDVTDKEGRKKTMKVKLRPPWLELYSEQVVVVDWPILTPSVVDGIARAAHQDAALTEASTTGTAAGSGTGSGASSHGTSRMQSSHSADDAEMNVLTGSFSTLEVEGQVFYEGQPVAVIPLHPSNLHPLMDDIIFKIMRAAPLLQVVLVVPDALFRHVPDVKHKMNWARKVVRRLWAHGGSLYQRIRLLPTPLSDIRLLKLLRQADLVLDTVPIGTSMNLLALAVSVGTPVVTLKTGTAVTTPREDLQELRVHLQLLLQAQLLQQRGEETKSLSPGAAQLTIGVGAAAGTKRRLDLNPMFRRLALNYEASAAEGSNSPAKARMSSDIPWCPSISAIAGYYERSDAEVAGLLVARNTTEYVTMASKLVIDREASYNLRVKLLDLVDAGADSGTATSTSSSSSSSHLAKSHTSSGSPDARQELLDLAQFMVRIGSPWATLREASQSCLSSRSKTRKAAKQRKGAILS